MIPFLKPDTLILEAADKEAVRNSKYGSLDVGRKLESLPPLCDGSRSTTGNLIR